MKLQTLVKYMEKIAPLELAEEWDNVGLLLGDREREIKRVMTCLTVDDAVADEAVERKIDCIVSHHPFPFHASKKWTADAPDGRILLKLVGSQIAVYSPHTAHDSAFFGVNRQLAEGLGLLDARSLYPGKISATREMLDGLDAEDARRAALDLAPNKRGAMLGTGRIGRLPKPKKFCELVEQVKDMLQIEKALAVGSDDKTIRTVAIGCGAADDFIARAQEEGADALLLGEARFHACLEARARDVALILAGHYATERFSACILADRISRVFPDLFVCASAKESDPLRVA